MSQKRTDQLYEFYRKSPDIAPSLAPLFQNLDQSPNNPRSHFELGRAAYETGYLQLSVECFSRVTKLAPQVEAGFFNLGNAFFDLQEFDNAKQAYEQAFRLNPDVGTLNNLGNSYAAMKDWQNAITTFERALHLSGGATEHVRTTRSNLSKALLAANDLDGAIKNLQQAILESPADFELLAFKANCHHQKFEFGKAVECLAQALIASPNNPELLCQIADVNFSRGRALESVLCMHQAFSLRPPPVRLQSRRLQMLAYCAPTTPERMLNEAVGWASSLIHSDHPSILSQPNSGSPKNADSFSQPLRVGFLWHSPPNRGLNDWLATTLGKCDSEKFQWFVFCDSDICNETQIAFDRAKCRLEFTSHLSDSKLAALINGLQINLLIDTIGHGLSTRLPVISRKPAPIQAIWGAFPMTSGLSQMDFIWSDSVAIPPESEKNFTERVIRFPSSSVFFQPSRPMDLHALSESSTAPFRCGFLSQPEQVSDPLIEAMQAILVNIPDSEIVFIGRSYRDLAFQAETRKKVETIPELANRVLFECTFSAEEELDLYQGLDVTLDAFLVSSPQRSFESLWMGVPVVTLLDIRLSARSTASILSSLYRDEWIATNQSEYVNAVKRLAECRVKWRKQRISLRNELLASPMCDISQMAKNMEFAIEETLRQFQIAMKSQ
jgi:protein O-GlcNAc transferase